MDSAVPKTIDAYISLFPKQTQVLLEAIRQTIKKEAPEAVETISYKMPAFIYYGMLVYFAAYKNHIGFYALPTAHKEFEKKLSSYKTGTGSVQFSLNKPIPATLIRKIVKFRMSENLSKQRKK